MRVATRTVYQFDELDDAAKDRARDWYRQGIGSDLDLDHVIEDAANVGDILGIDLRQRTAKLMDGSTRPATSVYWSGFHSQGDGASFDARYEYRRGSTRAIREHAPTDAELHRIADTLAALQRRYFYCIVARVSQSGRYCHEMTMRLEWAEATVRGEGRDLAADDAETLLNALRDFARWIYRMLEAEFEYLHSDECVDESIRANEYEFDEDGHRAAW